MLKLLKVFGRSLKMTRWLSQLFKNMAMTPAERYLSQATDLQDLERRQRDISRGRVRF